MAYHIVVSAKGDRKTALGHIWSFISLDEYKQFLAEESNNSEEAITYKNFIKLIQ